MYIYTDDICKRALNESESIQRREFYLFGIRTVGCDGKANNHKNLNMNSSTFFTNQM